MRATAASVLVLLLRLVTSADAAAQYRAGFTRVVAVEPVSGDSVPVAVWYPTLDAEREVQFGRSNLVVAPDGALASSGRLPLVLISHGTGGGELGHWDTAAELARAGFVVAAVRHPGDNVAEESGLGTDRQVFGRSHHVVAAARTLLQHPRWRSHLDSTRLGFFGFSAGGYTGLTLLGVRPETARFGPYCASHADDPTYCASGPRGTIRLTGVYQQPAELPGLRAAVLWAPAFGFLFSDTELRKLSTPVIVAEAEQDDVVLGPGNLQQLTQHLRLAEPPYVVQDAGHFVFLAPCSASLAAVVPAICSDPPGVDRTVVHRTLNTRLVAFMQANLAVTAGQR